MTMMEIIIDDNQEDMYRTLEFTSAYTKSSGSTVFVMITAR